MAECHWKKNFADVFFLTETKKSKKNWKISDFIIYAGQLVIENILFLHAWSGCDTTLATFGQGKTAILKKLKQSVEIQNISKILNDIEATPIQ